MTSFPFISEANDSLVQYSPFPDSNPTFIISTFLLETVDYKLAHDSNCCIHHSKTYTYTYIQIMAGTNDLRICWCNLTICSSG